MLTLPDPACVLVFTMPVVLGPLPRKNLEVQGVLWGRSPGLLFGGEADCAVEVAILEASALMVCLSVFFD